MKQTVIQQALKAVFEELTKNATTFVDWYGYKTAEIKTSGIEIGVGINDDFSAMKLFTIVDNREPNDTKRFKQTFRMGHEKNSKDTTWWSFELAQTNLSASERKFYEIANHLIVVSKIGEMIKGATSKIPAEQV